MLTRLATSEKAGGRIDETEHPFTTGYYDDVRITTHYYADNFSSSLFSILHEVGHALYEQNLPPKWIYQPIGESCSLGFHEFQSRLVENIIGRSNEFWTYFYPTLKEMTKDNFSHVKLNDFVHAINMVQPYGIDICSGVRTNGKLDEFKLKDFIRAVRSCDV